MADEITAGQALIELRATSDKLTADMAAVSKLITGELAKVEKEAANVGMAGLAKQIEDVAKATQAAQSQIQNLRFGAIADEVGHLTSALKGAESGVQITEDLARAESLLEERFAMVRAEIGRQAEAQRGLVNEEVLLQRTTLQLEAAQRQHDQALATVRGRAIQAAEGIAQLEAEEQASALAATKAWEATAQLAIEQGRATKEATELAAAEARTAQGLANLGTAITHAAEETQKANARWAAMKPTLTGVVDAAQAAGLAFGAFAGGVATVAGVSAKLTMEAAHIGESFNDLAIKTSTTVEALSRYDLAAKTADVSQETLAVGMRKLAQAAVEAGDDGSESAQAFKSLGVEVRDANGNIKPMGQLLQETTRALADAGDGAETMASAQQLLGRSAQDFLPLAKMTKEELDDLAKASEELGLVWSTKDAAAADKLSDSVTVLGAGVKGLGLSIGRDLIPVAQQVVDESLSWLRANSELMRSGFKDWVFGVKQIIEGLAPLVRDTADAFLWWGGGLDDTFGGLNQQIVDTEAKMKDLKRTMETPLMATGEVDKATKEYEHLALQLEGLKVRAEQAKNVQAPLASAVEGTTTALRDQKIVAKETGEQFDAMLINWEDANKAAEEAKRAQKEAAAEAKRLSDVNRGLADSIEQLKLDALSDDLDDATAALERNRSVVADESYLRALQDIQAAYESQVETIKRTTEEAVAAGADRTLAAEREALAVESAQRDMAQAVEKLDGVLVKNADYWGDVGKVVADLPPEMRALIPTLDAVALATGNVSEATKEAATDLVKLDGIASDLAKGLAQAITRSADWRGVGDAILATTLDATFTDHLDAALNDTFVKSIQTLTDPIGDALGGMFTEAFDALTSPLTSAAGDLFKDVFGASFKEVINKSAGKSLVSGLGEAITSNPVVASIVGGVAVLGTTFAVMWEDWFDKPDMQSRISKAVSKMIGKALRDPSISGAVDSALQDLGFKMTDGLTTAIVNAPLSGAEIRAVYAAGGEAAGQSYSDGFYQFLASENKSAANNVSASDLVNLYFPGSTPLAKRLRWKPRRWRALRLRPLRDSRVTMR
ncbi:MAG: hypothetical protein IPK07_34955 [Deltaproteobacteria bacterium]|nr:hypothetical protein [Deltaproteobacteria bacterium]